jgi:CRP-like cAMP-binding protein
MRDHSVIVRRIFKILCAYKPQPEGLYERLLEVMTGQFYPSREVLFDRGEVVTDAIFVSSGYVARILYDEGSDPQVVNIFGEDDIIAGKSFTEQKPSSEFALVALPGTYLMRISAVDIMLVYEEFDSAEELARLVMADMSERELVRFRLLKRDSETVISAFYQDFPSFLKESMMTDSDIASYLLISESTLRNVRAKLIRENRL